MHSIFMVYRVEKIAEGEYVRFDERRKTKHLRIHEDG